MVAEEAVEEADAEAAVDHTGDLELDPVDRTDHTVLHQAEPEHRTPAPAEVAHHHRTPEVQVEVLVDHTVDSPEVHHLEEEVVDHTLLVLDPGSSLRIHLEVHREQVEEDRTSLFGCVPGSFEDGRAKGMRVVVGRRSRYA